MAKKVTAAVLRRRIVGGVARADRTLSRIEEGRGGSRRNNCMHALGDLVDVACAHDSLALLTSPLKARQYVRSKGAEDSVERFQSICLVGDRTSLGKAKRRRR